MKGRKLLAGVLSAAMLLSTAALPAFAEDEWDNNTIKITDPTNGTAAYYDDWSKAIAAVNAIETNDVINVDCKADEEITASGSHNAIKNSVNIEGNGARLMQSDLTIEHFEAGALTKDISVTVNNLTGANVWGTRNTDKTADITVTNCKDVKLILVLGQGDLGKTNVTLDNCSFAATDDTTVYLKTAGTTVIKDCTFKSVGRVAVNITKETNGEQDVSVTGCTFKDCATDAESEYAAPIRFVNRANGNINATVADCTITGTLATNGDVLLGDGRNDQVSNPNVSLKISGTAAEIQVQEPGKRTTPTVKKKVTAEESEVLEIPAAVEVNGAKYATLKDALAAAVAGDTVTIFGKVAVEPHMLADKKLTFNGKGETAEMTFVDGLFEQGTTNNAYFANGSTLTFNNLKVTWKDTENYQGLRHATEVQYNNCVISGQLFLYGKTETFNNCKFVQTASNAYNVWAYGADLTTFNDCQFESTGKSVLVYNEGALTAGNVSVKKCTFSASSPIDGKAAIEVDSRNTDYNIDIDAETTATGFGTGSTSGNSLYNVKYYKVVTDTTDNSKRLNTEIKVNGEVVMPLSPEKMAEEFGQSVAKVGSKVYTTLKDTVKGANDGDTITLLTDTTVPDDFGGGMINFYGKHGSYVVDCNGYRLNGGITAFNYPTEENLTVTIVNADINTTYRKSETGVMIQFAAVYNAMKGGKTVVENGTFSSDNIVVCQQGGELEIQDGTYIMRAEDGAVVYTNDGITTIKNGTFKGADGVESVYAIHAEERGTVKVSGGTFVGAVEAIDNGKIEISGGTFEGDFSTEGNGAISITGGTFSTDVSAYCADGFKARFVNGKFVVDEDDSTDTVTLKFEPAGENVYDIVLSGNGAVINRLNVAEFKFDMSNPAVSYEIKAADKLTTLQPDVDKYVFYFDGKDDINGADTAAEITIGTVTFDGVGDFTFKATAGKVTDTTMKDNLVNEFVVDGATGKGTLVIDDPESIINGNITIPSHTLTVNVLMNHSIGDNAADYQNMTVAISGGDLAGQVLTYNLGDADNAAITKVTNANGKVISYQVKAELRENRLYTVTVTGAGYRTARYTVTMNDNKTMNVWNNAMSEDTVVVDKTKAMTNFLAGDIVKDGNVNIYDLSAVVAYFGTDNLVTDHPTYAKYDLNRDGVIDMMDISIVLTSWGK